MIRLEKVTKSYHDLLAVDHLDLTVNQELFVFLGPNGAGKTTTIKMMTGLLTADEGIIELDGINIKNNPKRAKQIFGYLAEHPHLYAKLTPKEFIDLLLAVYRVPPEQGYRRMQQLFEIFEMTDYADVVIEDLSGGMTKKVALVAALIHQPRIIFLDEPTVSLDPKAARHLKDLLRGLVNRGVTVFMTTHILQVAETMCDRVGIINKGKMCAVGTLDELRAEHGKDLSLEDLFLKLTGDVFDSKIDAFLQDNG